MKKQFRELWLSVKKPQAEGSFLGLLWEPGRRKPGRDFLMKDWVPQLKDIAHSRRPTEDFVKTKWNKYTCKVPRVIPVSSFTTFMLGGEGSNVIC